MIDSVDWYYAVIAMNDTLKMNGIAGAASAKRYDCYTTPNAHARLVCAKTQAQEKIARQADVVLENKAFATPNNAFVRSGNALMLNVF